MEINKRINLLHQLYLLFHFHQNLKTYNLYLKQIHQPNQYNMYFVHQKELLIMYLFLIQYYRVQQPHKLHHLQNLIHSCHLHYQHRKNLLNLICFFQNYLLK